MNICEMKREMTNGNVLFQTQRLYVTISGLMWDL